MHEDNAYYVYVYIDPRNFEEFYYGKGKGLRKLAHLEDMSDSAKTKRISEIKRAGLYPIIKVIANDLREDEALLVEKTLLWKLGKWTTNKSSGSFAANFRPHNTLHKDLPGFDYQNSIYYYNVGEGVHRNWDDYCRYGFISAGQGPKWRDAMLGFCPSDIVVAYLKRHGFVGIGRIKTKAKMINEIIIKGKPLLSLPLKCKNMDDNCENPMRSEYVCEVKWICKVPREEAKWLSKANLYTTTHIRASLEGQPSTLEFLQKAFKIHFSSLI